MSSPTPFEFGSSPQASSLSSQAHALDVSKDLHTIALLVRNAPGVLVRVAMVFSRRGYNIESLVVSPGARTGFSRMTVTCSGDPSILEQMIKQLSKLVDVVNATDHTGDAAYESEIALVKVAAKLEERTEILQIAEHFGNRKRDEAYAEADRLIVAFCRAHPLEPSGKTELSSRGGGC